MKDDSKGQRKACVCTHTCTHTRTHGLDLRGRPSPHRPGLGLSRDLPALQTVSFFSGVTLGRAPVTLPGAQPLPWGLSPLSRNFPSLVFTLGDTVPPGYLSSLTSAPTRAQPSSQTPSQSSPILSSPALEHFPKQGGSPQQRPTSVASGSPGGLGTLANLLEKGQM